MTGATIHKEAFQRLTLLYLIGQFPKGVFSSFRLQKVLYYATRDVEPKPFTFHHTTYGQYSRDAAVQLLTMLEDWLVKQETLHGTHEGSCWKPGDVVDQVAVTRSFKTGFPSLSQEIETSAKNWGFIPQNELDDRAHADPILKKVRKGGVLHKESPGWHIDILLSEDDAGDLEMLLGPGFLSGMARMGKAIAEMNSDVYQQGA